MEKHKCKICSRTFSNGRALGGHMKAHLATLKRLPSKPQSPSFSSYSQSQSQEEQKPLIYADPDFSLVVVAPDRESETESKNPTRQLRSKRNRKSSYKHFTALSTPSPPLSSVSDTSPEEDVAMCLMMLSRDNWKKNNNNNINVIQSAPLKRVRGKHVCQNCTKAFRSSKALTSHTTVCYPHHPHHHHHHENDDSKIFECPFCFKVFGSGQALGGHKRSHLIIPSSSSTSRILNFIDLNLPAPLEEDHDLGVLSDA